MRARHSPRRRFGQHFLHESGVVRRIVDAIGPEPGDTVVEIGPGLGALTRPLLERLSHLHVVEIDRDLTAALREEFEPRRLTVHEGDALAFDFTCLSPPLRVIGNLPYNISTPLLFHVAAFAARLRDCHFMLQREVVDRLVARPSTPQYGRLSIMLQYRFETERLFIVQSGAFRPAPKVESAIVRMLPRHELPLDAIAETWLARIAAQAFTKRRKTLRNALAGMVTTDVLERAGIDPGLRPEALAIEDFVRLAATVRAVSSHPDSRPGQSSC